MKILKIVASCILVLISAESAFAKDKVSVSGLRKAINNPDLVLDIIYSCAARPGCVVVPQADDGSNDDLEVIQSHAAELQKAIASLTVKEDENGNSCTEAGCPVVVRPYQTIKSKTYQRFPTK